MNHSIKTRIKAGALAAMMLLTTIPVSALTAVTMTAVTAEAAVAGDPVLTFKAGDTAEDATVITGQSIDIIETYNSGTYVSNGISISVGNGVFITEGNAADNGVTITKNETNSSGGNVTRTYSLRFDSKFDPEGATGQLLKSQAEIANIARKKLFTIEGTYSKKFSETYANEKPQGSGTVNCRVIVGNDMFSNEPLAIMTRSTLKFRCTKSETVSTPPEFVLTAATGYFEDYGKMVDSNNKEVATGGTIRGQITTTTPRTADDNLNDGAEQKVIGITLSGNGVSTVGFTLYPLGTYSHDDPNDPGQPDDWDEEKNGKYKPAQIPDNLIRGHETDTSQSTEFEIVFEPPTSTSLFLTVMTPQAVMEEIEQQLVNSDTTGVGDQSYIRLNQREALGYIESDFDLRYMATRYNSTFYVDWRWIPTGIMWDSQFTTVAEWAKETVRAEVKKETGKEPTDAQLSGTYKKRVDDKIAEVTPQFTTLLKPPTLNNSAGYSSWLSAGLPNSERDRLEDDVQGYLFPTVYYADNNNQKSTTLDQDLATSELKFGTSDSIDAKITKIRKILGTETGFTSSVIEPKDYYTKGTAATEKDKNPNYPLKQVIIKGTGVKPSGIGTGKVEGDPTRGPVETKNMTDGFNANTPNNPNIIDMDAYQGGIPEYNEKIKGPFQYTLTLNMGQKNGASPYARVDVSGDLNALTFEYDADDGNNAQAVPPGTASFTINNGKYEDGGPNIDEGHPWLTMTLQPYPNDVKERGTVFLTITFFKKNADGSIEVNNNAVYYFRINPNDSTPGQDNRLYGLIIRDQSDLLIGPERGFSFDKDTYNYEVTIPFSSNAIKLFPTMYDTDAVGETRPIALQMTDKENQTVEIRRLDMTRYGYPVTKVKDSGGNDVIKYADSILLNEDGEPSNAYRIYNAQWSFLIPFYEQVDETIFPNYAEYEDKDDIDGKNTRVGQSYTLRLTTPTHDPRPDRWKPAYTIKVTRAAPSQVNTLDAIGIYLETAEVNAANNLLTGFNPENDTYHVWIPYSTQRLRVQTKLTDPLSAGPYFTIGELFKDDEKKIYKYDQLEKMTSSGAQEWIQGVKDKFRELSDLYEENEEEWDGTMKLQFTVKSEYGKVKDSQRKNGDGEKTYTVVLHREDPNTDPNMRELIVTDKDENVLEYTPAFRPDTGSYTLEVPYSIKQVKFNVGTNDPNVWKVEIWQGDAKLSDDKKEVVPVSDKTTIELKAKYGEELTKEEIKAGVTPLRLGVLSSNMDVEYILSEYAQARGGYHPFHIFIWAENETEATDYLVRVRRQEPSHDASMSDMLLKNQNNEEIKTFVYNPEQYGPDGAYHISVPFSTKGVSFTVSTTHQFATIRIKEELLGTTMKPFPAELQSGATSRVYDLKDPGEEKLFIVEIRAEDWDLEDQGGKGTSREYYVYISREAPSSDARLKALETQNTSNFKPIFISSKTAYTADVNEGAPGVIIIPTANHPGATIRVDGVTVASGTPTDLIELLEVTQTVTIEVIAEDGVTRMFYKITFTNWNLVEKTSNADLSRLTVNYGLMTPNFQPAVINYEVTAKENAWSVDIIPKVADPLAKMRVMNGTLELGDYNGNYAMAIADGQSTVNIEVTSPDETVTKTYTVDIFRGEDDKLKNWTPLEAEDIDFEHVSNPIIVKVEEYPRVGASVFNTLREEYPDYSIVFQGNDYSLRFDAKNLTRVIPQTEIYDFHMSLTSPDEDAIYDLIASRSANNDIIDDVVMLYFDYHGSLPGPATLSVSLGHRYGNDLLYWHYYNKERDRIDYYGTLESNSQGNIAVSIDHFSTYLVSPEHRIAGSEDKDGVVDELGMISNGEDLLGSGGKLNPNTGAAPTANNQESGVFPELVSRPDVYIRKKEDP